MIKGDRLEKRWVQHLRIRGSTWCSLSAYHRHPAEAWAITLEAQVHCMLTGEEKEQKGMKDENGWKVNGEDVWISFIFCISFPLPLQLGSTWCFLSFWARKLQCHAKTFGFHAVRDGSYFTKEYLNTFWCMSDVCIFEHVLFFKLCKRLIDAGDEFPI